MSSPPEPERLVRPIAAELIISAAGPAQFPEPTVSEFAFAGRSNVGKSSLLNRLAGRKSLARTSGEPGKTRLLNFFRVDCLVSEEGGETRRSFVLVDLPGYGYARVPKEERKRWRALVEQYMNGRDALRAVVVLQDLRREISDQEHDLFAWFDERSIPSLLALTKTDKFPPMRRAQRVRALMEASELPRDRVVVTSSVTGDGIAALWRALQERA